MSQSEKTVSCPSCGALCELVGEQCQNCGGSISHEARPARRQDEVSSTVKVYTGIFVAWALIFPFLLPIILKLSHECSL